MYKALVEAYTEEGYKRGVNANKRMLQLFMEKGLVSRERNAYHYHPDVLFSK